MSAGPNETIWEQIIAFDEGQTRLWHIGYARFWIQRKSGDWFIAFEPAAGSAAGITGVAGSSLNPESFIVGIEGEPLSGLQWTRYVAGNTPKIAVRPVLPDRPVVVKPGAPVKVLAGRSTQFFFHVPVWLAITESADRNPLLLAEHPGLLMSNTWFGDPDSGELCYSLTTLLASSPSELRENPLAAICPLKISNEAPQTLDFQRVAVRVPYLRLYRGARYLSTNEVELIYHAPDQSQITLHNRVPGFDAEIRHVSQPRQTLNRGIIQKSFEFIRSLSNY